MSTIYRCLAPLRLSLYAPLFWTVALWTVVLMVIHDWPLWQGLVKHRSQATALVTANPKTPPGTVSYNFYASSDFRWHGGNVRLDDLPSGRSDLAPGDPLTVYYVDEEPGVYSFYPSVRRAFIGGPVGIAVLLVCLALLGRLPRGMRESFRLTVHYWTGRLPGQQRIFRCVRERRFPDLKTLSVLLTAGWDDPTPLWMFAGPFCLPTSLLLSLPLLQLMCGHFQEFFGPVHSDAWTQDGLLLWQTCYWPVVRVFLVESLVGWTLYRLIQHWPPNDKPTGAPPFHELFVDGTECIGLPA